MTSKLKHPRVLFRRRSQDREEVEILPEHRAAASPPCGWGAAARERRWTARIVRRSSVRPSFPAATRSSPAPVRSTCLVDLIALHDLLNFLEALQTEHGCQQRHASGSLYGTHVLQADAGPWN